MNQTIKTNGNPYGEAGRYNPTNAEPIPVKKMSMPHLGLASKILQQVHAHAFTKETKTRAGDKLKELEDEQTRRNAIA